MRVSCDKMNECAEKPVKKITEIVFVYKIRHDTTGPSRVSIQKSVLPRRAIRMNHYVAFVQAAQFPNVLRFIRPPRLYTTGYEGKDERDKKWIFSWRIFSRPRRIRRIYIFKLKYTFLRESSRKRTQKCEEFKLPISSWLWPSSKTPSKRGSGGTGWPWEPRWLLAGNPVPMPVATSNKIIIRVVAILLLTLLFRTRAPLSLTPAGVVPFLIYVTLIRGKISVHRRNTFRPPDMQMREFLISRSVY